MWEGLSLVIQGKGRLDVLPGWLDLDRPFVGPATFCKDQLAGWMDQLPWRLYQLTGWLDQLAGWKDQLLASLDQLDVMFHMVSEHSNEHLEEDMHPEPILELGETWRLTEEACRL